MNWKYTREVLLNDKGASQGRGHVKGQDQRASISDCDKKLKTNTISSPKKSGDKKFYQILRFSVVWTLVFSSGFEYVPQ